MGIKIDNLTKAETVKLQTLHDSFSQSLQRINAEVDTSVVSLKKRIVDAISTLFMKSSINKKLSILVDKHNVLIDEHNARTKEVKKLLASVMKKVDDVRDGEDGSDGDDGKDADEEKIIEQVLANIEIPTAKELSADDIADSLETLKGKGRLKVSAIEGLEDRLEQRPLLGKRGGGTSAMGVKYALGRIVKSETPSGLLNGSNTDYTVTQDIHAIFSFALNGEAITDDQYTFVGRTITFSTAIPAAYSGKSFKIVYA